MKNTSNKKNKTNEVFKNKQLIFTLGAVFFLFALLSLFLTFDFHKDSSSNKSNLGQYKIKIHIDFTSNIIFSRYDVNMSVGKQKKYLEHGEDADTQFYLDKGEYTLTFTSDDDSSIKHEEKLIVNSNMELTYRITCHSDKIEVEIMEYESEADDENKMIKFPYSKLDLITKNYKEVASKLEKVGFTNVKTVATYDLTLYGLYDYTSNGDIIDIKINNSTDFGYGVLYDKDAEIVINYHARDIDDPNRIVPPYDGNTAKGIDYETILDAFKKAGFKNVKVEGVAGSGMDKTVSGITIDSMPANLDSNYSPNDSVYIYYYDASIEIEQKEEKLQLYYARKAFEEYGEKLYRYGFKCHWWVGLLDEKENSDGSFSFVVEVTITNQYGAEYDAVAQGTVSGTNGNPIVLSFNVY